MKSILITTSTLGLALFAAQPGSAQPTGSITNPITGAANALWDCSRLTNELQDIELDIRKVSKGGTNGVDIAFADPFTQNGAGKLAGAGTTSVVLIPDITEPQTNAFQGTYGTKGSITSSKGVAHLVLSVKVSGHTVLDNNKGVSADRAVAATANYTVKLDANAGQVTGRVSERASAAGVGSISDTRQFAGSIPADLGNGSWTLVLNFGAANGSKLTGNATVTLQTGAVYPFSFTGTFAPRSQQSKLNLKGEDAGKGSVLQVTLQKNAITANVITKIVGRVAGQSVNYIPAAVPGAIVN
jgi:hypothetical protein